ncbi:MAG: hypothetical protein KAI47_02890 [Deltaproteobacteria bacterium]|nr:hypothetical protein [Deltaproteobacteria bacterium]
MTLTGGTYLAWSDSYFNNVEMIEWTNTSGSARVVNLKVRLWQHVFSSCAGQQRERFAVAYAIHQGHLIND